MKFNLNISRGSEDIDIFPIALILNKIHNAEYFENFKTEYDVIIKLVIYINIFTHFLTNEACFGRNLLSYILFSSKKSFAQNRK